MPLLVHQATALSDCISTAVANTEIGYIEQHISSSNIALAAGKDDSQAHVSWQHYKDHQAAYRTYLKIRWKTKQNPKYQLWFGDTSTYNEILIR